MHRLLNISISLYTVTILSHVMDNIKITVTCTEMISMDIWRMASKPASQMAIEYYYSYGTDT